MVQIYDYVDADVPMLMRMYGKRVNGYKAIGHVIADREGNGNQPRLKTESPHANL